MANSVLASLLLNIVAKSDVSGLNKTTKSLKNMGTQANKTSSLLKAMSTKLFGGFNISNAIDMGMKYLQFEKDLGAMQSRFFAITGDQKKAREEFDYIRKVATDTALDIKSTADSYSIFYSAAAKSMGSGGARQVFKDWTEVSRVLHLTPYQFERVTYALREMASKGAIYSQDLRMQIGTHVPNAMGLAQKAVEDLGITGTDWFEKFQKQAKGNQPLINEFIKNFSKYAKMQFAAPQALKMALQQPDALANYIKNMGYNFMIEFSQKGGNEAVIKILESFKDALLKIDYAKLAEVLGSIAKGVGKIFEYLPQIISILKDIALSVAIFYTGKLFSGLLKFGSTALMASNQGKLVPWLMLKAGFGKAMTGAVLKGGIGALGKFGIKNVFSKLLGFIGGPWVAAIMWLPEICHLISFIWGKFKGDNKTGLGKWQEYLNNYGASESNILATMKAVQEAYNKSGGKMDIKDVQERASWYLGHDLGQKVTITDQGQVVLNFNGSFLTYEELQSMIKRATQENNKKKEGFWNNLFNKPMSSGIKEGPYNEWGVGA